MQDFPAAELLPATAALPPVRGLLPLHNAAGSPIALPDCHRALRYQCHSFAVRKVDLLADLAPSAGAVESMLAYAREFQVRIALRTNGAWSPTLLAQWAAQGLFDVCLAGAWPSPPQEWLDACRACNLPVRLLLPVRSDAVDAAAIEAWTQAGVRCISFLGDSPATEAWCKALRARSIDAVAHACPDPAAAISLLAPPARSFFQDHQQYDAAAYAFAARCYQLSPRALHSRLIFDALRAGGIETPSDRRLVNFLRVYTPLYRPVLTAARAVRHRYAALPQTAGAAESTVPVDDTPRYFDAVDRERRDEALVLQTLAQEAADWQRRESPSTVFSSDGWGFVNADFDPMRGVNQLHALLPGEKLTTKLPYLRLPFMVTVTLGGGIADAAGFAVGRHIRIACPMVAASHQLTLYTDTAGRYVLLRDGHPVAPSLLEGRGYTPPRLPDGAHLQVAVWSPETEMSITDIRVWHREEAARDHTAKPQADVAIVIFSTRFARRLQAVLQSLLHQDGIALERMQCIIGLVPGLDGAEDVVDSFRHAHPEWPIETVALPAQFDNSKGFALNECLQRVHAPVVAMLDSDILLPPRFLRAALDAAKTHGFIAPAGRAMLDAATTAPILLGEVLPWEDFDALAQSAPEMRVEENPQEVPLGYCQVFRASALEHIAHAEYGHFGAADFEFGQALKKHFHGAHRLPLPVLHLDHDARQWFGARKHY
jgi:hypothetical protein